MYEMYQNNGINAKITLNSMIVNFFKNFQQESDDMFGFHEFDMGSYLSKVTGGFVSQSTLIDDDLLLLTHKKSGFERILIFDRPDHHKDLAMRLHGNENINLYKKIFMRLL